jgi:23S rRNA (uracil1939-C5)-methyltransferase
LDGDGIGRLPDGAEAGKVAFVPYSLPSEVVRARLLVRKKNLSRWLPNAVESTSPDRIDPPCSLHFKPGRAAPWCGGCNWQHITAAAQADAKRRLLAESLERLGGISTPPVTETIRSPLEWRYRNKVQVPFGIANRRVVAGFYAPESHSIVEFDDCLVQPELSVRMVSFIKKLARDWRWPPYQEDANRGWLRHALVRTNEAGQALVSLVTATPQFRNRARFVDAFRKEFPSTLGLHQNIQRSRTNVILGHHWIRLWGADRIEERVAGLRLQYSAGAFFQVNTRAAELLYQKAIDELGITSNDVVADLYCGAGALTLAAARRAKAAVGIESVASAIRDARHNAQLNSIRNAEFVEANAESLFSDRGSPLMEKLSGQPLLMIVDPPRSGCAPEVVQAMLRLRPRRIVYVSCHPATLARDVKLLSSAYALAVATPFDLFPQTAHIEAVARLELK